MEGSRGTAARPAATGQVISCKVFKPILKLLKKIPEQQAQKGISNDLNAYSSELLMLPWDALVSSSKTSLLALCMRLPPKEVSLFPSSRAFWSFSTAQMCMEEGITHPEATTPTCPCIRNRILAVFINTKANCRGWMNNSSTFSKSSRTRK